LDYLNGSLFGFAASAPPKAGCFASLLACPKQAAEQTAERRLKLRLWLGNGRVPASPRPGR